MVEVIDERHLRYVSKVLLKGEVVELTIRQRRVAPGGAIISPHIIIATNERVLIFNRDVLGINERFDTIFYNRITHVEVTHGLLSSTVIFGVVAHAVENPESEGESIEISGFRYQDAIDLARLVEEKLVLKGTPEKMNVPEEEAVEARLERVASERMETVCRVCGAKNGFTARYCGNCGAHL